MKPLRLLAAASLAALALTAGAAAQEFTLKLHHLLGPTAPAQTRMLEPWAERIAEATDGRVEIEIYPSMSLGGAPPELINQVRDGVVDLIWTVNGYTPGLFQRVEAFELPFVHTNDARATNLAMYDMFEEYLAEEFVGVKVMWLHVHAGQGIQMVDTEVRSPDDLAGKKMRIPTRTGAWVLEAMGASPVGMPVPELPQALSKKVVDGALIPWEIIPPLKLQDLTDYQIEGADRTRFGTTTFQVSMNIDTWNSLPPDIQEAFNEVNGADWWAEVGEIWTESEVGGLQMAVDAGNTHVQLTEEEMAAFREKLEPVVDRWVEDVTAAGIDGATLVAKARELIAEHSGHSM